MWVSVRTKRVSIRPRLRAAIERYVRRILERDRARISSVVVYLSPARVLHDDIEYACRVVVWGSSIGQIAVNHVSFSIREAVGKAARRARRIVRQRAKRRVDYGRMARHFAALEQEAE